MLVPHDLTPTTGRPLRAVVAGSGPGGAAAALLLARVGFTVTVLERVAAPTAVGGALLLQPNGIAVLQGLGVEHVPGERELRSSRIRNAAGRVLLDATVARRGRRRPQPGRPSVGALRCPARPPRRRCPDRRPARAPRRRPHRRGSDRHHPGRT